MNSKALRALNPLLILIALIQSVTGIVLALDLKLTFTESLLDFHKYNGLLLVALIILHMIFNWGWIRLNLLNKKPIVTK